MKETWYRYLYMQKAESELERLPQHVILLTNMQTVFIYMTICGQTVSCTKQMHSASAIFKNVSHIWL